MFQPRLPPVPVGERTSIQREVLRSVGGDATPNVFATLLHNPALFETWLPFCLKLLRQSAFSRRERELIILRTAWLCRSGYEWRSHLSIARRAGLTDSEIRALTQDPGRATWAARDRALLDAVGELHRVQVISERTWARLRVELNLDQLVELPMLVGNYILLASTLNSLRVALDPDLLAGDDIETPQPRAEKEITCD